MKYSFGKAILNKLAFILLLIDLSISVLSLRFFFEISSDDSDFLGQETGEDAKETFFFLLVSI